MMKPKLYLMEAAGLAIFMASACFFSAKLEGLHSPWHKALPDGMLRLCIMGLAMGLTALFIFYSPFTAPSGSHINPAVTLAFLRVRRINTTDAFFYIIFQLAGGILAVYLMAWLLKDQLSDPPVRFVVTVPGQGEFKAAVAEFITGFLMMTMVLNVSSSRAYAQYTRPVAAIFVMVYVIVAGPVSGFGMNPARSLASAVPSGVYTSFWIYMLMPVAAMMAAAELFLYRMRRKGKARAPSGIIGWFVCLFAGHWARGLSMTIQPAIFLSSGR